jgi:hypothetical protein
MTHLAHSGAPRGQDEARCNDHYTLHFETFLAATQEMNFDESE